MKLLRTSCLALACAFILSCAAASAFAETGVIRGDANGDGEVTIYDVTAIQKKLAQLPSNPFVARAADIDAAGLDIADATMIQSYLAEFGNPYHIGELIPTPQPPTEKYELPFIANH